MKYTIKNKKLLVLAQTAVMLALLIGVQLATSPLKNQFITGTLVNLVLLISVFMIGLGGGLTVAAVSPVLAFFFGMGPQFIQIVPFIAVGNMIFVSIAGLVRKHVITKGVKETLITSGGLVAASAAKVLFLWVGVVIIALPLIPGIPEKQIAMLSLMFSWPQIVTSLIGSALAIAVAPLLKKAVDF